MKKGVFKINLLKRLWSSRGAWTCETASEWVSAPNGAIRTVLMVGDPSAPFSKDTIGAPQRVRRVGEPAFCDRWPDFGGRSSLGDWLSGMPVQARDPLDGKLVECLGSIVLPAPSEAGGGSRGPTVCFLFSGRERFAVLAGLPSSLVFAVWLPDRGEILFSGGFAKEVMEEFCQERLVKVFSEATKSIVSRNSSKNAIPGKRWVLCEVHRNIGHTLWEELPYLEELVAAGFRGEFVSLGYDVFPVSKIFPELAGRVRRFRTERELNKCAAEEGALIVKVAHSIIPEGLVTRLRSWPTFSESPALPDNGAFRRNRGVWIGLRGLSDAVNPRGGCLNQVEVYCELIRRIAKLVGDFYVVIDGVTALDSGDPPVRINHEVRMFEQIRANLNMPELTLVSAVGERIERKIAMVKECRFAVCSYGASLAIPAWIGDLDVVAHATPSFLDRWAKEEDIYSAGWSGCPSRRGRIFQYSETKIDAEENYLIDVDRFCSFVERHLQPEHG